MRRTVGTASAAGIGAGVVLFAAGFGFGRADVALSGMVLLVAVGVALARGTRGAGAIDLRIEEEEESEGDDGSRVAETRVRVRIDAPGADAVRVSTLALGFASLPISVAPPASIVYPLPVVHSGRQELLAVSGRRLDPDAVRVDPATAVRTLRASIPPRAVPMPFLPLPRILGGLTGSHDSRRPGEGGEFRDLHPFTAGDRLRRIDWRTTARLARTPGDLYVRRTLATADADVALVLDDRDDVSGAPGSWSSGDRSLSGPTSLDIAREAAWSLASAYLDAGDHVSYQALTHAATDIVRGSGARQRAGLRATITAAEGGSPLARVGTPRVPRGALVVLLSTVLDDDPVELALRWRGSGHRVLVVDTLPRPRSERVRREVLIAERIVLAERNDRLRMLRSVGADLLRWDAPTGERRAVLRSLTRTRRRG